MSLTVEEPSMFWIKFITNFLKILRAGQTPKQIAGGFALGAIVGFCPVLTLQGLVVWLIIFLLDVNLSAALFAFAAFKLFAYVFDPVFHSLGYFLLVDITALQGFWTYLYNAPLAPLSRFYNTVVLGSFVSGVILFVPIYFGMKRFVVAYRTHIHAKVEQWKIYKILSRNSLVQWYQRIRSLGV
jgi:uncharacterized protein (TIGR03546 family)